MKTRNILLLGALGSALLLSGSAGAAPQPKGQLDRGQVTRFHADQPIAPGTVSIRPIAGDPSDIEFRTYAGVIAQSLGRAGFQVVDPGQPSTYVAAVDVRREPFTAPPKRSNFSIGFGGASFGRHTGLGLGTDVGIGGRGAREAMGTELTIQLRPGPDAQALWEGRARSSAEMGSPAGDASFAVGRLADAMLADFPGPAGRTVAIK